MSLVDRLRQYPSGIRDPHDAADRIEALEREVIRLSDRCNELVRRNAVLQSQVQEWEAREQ